MFQNNLISIILTTYNAEKFIERTIKSILDQSYKEWELIVVDDCSQDDTNDILEKLLKNKKNVIKIINKKNIGCNKSRNLAINLAKGKYLALLDHDDYWLPEKLNFQINFHLKKKCSMSCTYYRRFNLYNNVGKLIKPPFINTRNQIYCQNNIGYSSVMIDKEVVKKFEMIDSPLSDLPTWTRLLKNNYTVLTLEKDLMRYFYDKSTDSSNKIKIAIQRWRVLRELEKLSFFISLFYFIKYFLKSVIKYKNL